MDEKNEILIIDDDEGTRKTLTFILKKKGFNVVTAGTGEEGLRLAQGRKISVALLDINLPDIEGIRLIAPLKEIHPGLSVIMITGYASMENAMRALNEGATGYVLKPVKIDEILAKIDDAFERQHLIKNKLQAEEALRISEEKYRNLVENINEVIYSLDERGVFTYISPVIEKISGYPPSHLTGQPFAGFIVKEDLPGVMQAFEAGMKDIITSFPFRIVTKSGDPRWLSASTYPAFTNGNLSGVHGVLSDITERKQAEDALQKSEEKFRIVADYTYDWEYWIAPDGTYVYMSPSCERVTGYSAKKFYNNPSLFDEIIHPQDKSAYRKHMELSHVSTSPESVEYRIIRKDGCIRWISHICQPMYGRNGELLGRRSSNRDVTERREAEVALRESEEKFRAFFVTSMDCVFITTLDGKWVDFNDAAITLLGYDSREELLNVAIRDLYADPAGRDAHTSYIREQGYSLEFPVDLQKKDKTIINTLITSVPRKDAEGNVIGFQGTIRDITERKRAEEEIKRSIGRFRTVMDSIDAFVYVADMQTFELLFLNKYGRDIWGDIEGKVCWQTIQADQKGPCPFCTNDRLVDENGNPTGIYNWEFKNTVNGRWYDCRDSAIRWLDGRLVRIEIATDITERKQMEETLHKSEQKFRDLFENSRDGIVIGDTRTQQFVDNNQMFSQMLGYSQEEIKNIGVVDIHPKDGQSSVIELFEKMTRHEINVSENIPVMRKDGTTFYADISAYPINISGKDYLVGVFRDITERKQAEELRKHFTEELELQVRSRTQELRASLDEKVILLREIHHRVRNNLQIIISLVKLQMRNLEDPQLRLVMAETQNRVQAMALVHEKLYQSENLARIDFADYTRFLANQLFSYFGTDKRKVHLDVVMGEIMVDINTAVPLGLLMNELISNTLKHAFPQGREGTIIISGGYEGDLITLVVRDNGIGIPADLDWKNTTSLGMRLVTSLVDQIDGTITLDRNNGTSFTITVRKNPVSVVQK